MSVNVMNGLHYNCQYVNQVSFLECEPTKEFLHGGHTIVSVQVYVNVSGTFILDGFECLYSGMLMQVPHDAAIFHGWPYMTLVDFTYDRTKQYKPLVYRVYARGSKLSQTMGTYVTCH